MPAAVDLPARTLLTALFDSIAAIDIPPPPRAAPPPSTHRALPPPNPLRNLPAQSRNLFLTAHCLLPTTFLEALSLLEKDLVVRYTVDTPAPCPPSSHIYYIRSTPPPPASLAIPGPNFTAKPVAASPQPKGAKSYVYEVRPAAWNCTCIAFTLATYQRHKLLHTQNKEYGNSGAENSDNKDAENAENLGASEGGGSGGDDNDDDIENTGRSGQTTYGGNGPGSQGVDIESDTKYNEEYLDSDAEDYQKAAQDGTGWYGGVHTLSHDAGRRPGSKGGGGVPVCKHLLAAVLAERCSGLFGGYVVERVVSVEEMAEMAVLWD
ncbi:hypothetical protein DRE_04259 [Drechslerella stenobrocha 248]|uniref:SWIM-type domain-containing protein n=1 Tax=Drechslerella stenobrocha 248 TaxID=1043628 RepID=W7HR92_9PEZI|nr:hypothetical protein DRE_04259 [Drechslerella stenobrocha 248]